MVEANLQIISELKAFVEIVSEQEDIKSLFTTRPSDFERNRKLTISNVLGVLLNSPKRSLSVEVRESFECFSEGITCTKSAFTQRRTKLKPLFLQVFNKLLVELFYHYYDTKVKRWHGHILQAIDGSNAYLPNVPQLADYFGTQGNQHGDVPMALIMTIYDVLNDITILADIFSTNFSEQEVACSWVDKLLSDGISLFDRGYPSYSLIYLLENQEQERLFVMRARKTFNNVVKEFVASDEKDIITYFYPNDEAIKTLYSYGHIVTKQIGVKVRLTKITLSTGETEILISNLYDMEKYAIEDLSELYSLRWGIETAYDKDKNKLQLEQFSGIRPICIEQDFHAIIIVSNLQSLIEKQSEQFLKEVSEKRKYEYKINKNVSIASMKNKLIKLFTTEIDAEQLLIYLQHLFEQNIEPVRPNRKYPRKRKSKRLNGKYQTLTNYKRAI